MRNGGPAEKRRPTSALPRNERGFGLYDYNARYYSVLGRFVSPDSILPEPGSSGGFNRYRYARNNPLKYTDPSGHAVDAGCGCGGAAAADDDGNGKNYFLEGVDFVSDQLEAAAAIASEFSLPSLSSGYLKFGGPFSTFGDGYGDPNPMVEKSLVGSGFVESIGIFLELYGPIDGLAKERIPLNAKVGGGLVIGAVGLEYMGRQAKISDLAAQGENPVILTKMDYEAKYNAFLKTGEAHVSTLGPSLMLQFTAPLKLKF